MATLLVLTLSGLGAIGYSLTLLHRKADTIMATELDLETHLAAIADGVVALAKEISDLKVTGAQLVTQEQLDAADAKAQAIVAAIEAAK